jgi:F-type H+-transporting ATPase subunit b
MLIDWFTVLAQIANFLILVWLMKRYLYHPILNAIDAREKRIATQIADAANNVKDATKEREQFAQKNKTFDQERDKLWKAAQDDAKAETQKLLEAARHDADAIRARRNAALVDESKTLGNDLASMIQNRAFAIARQTLAGLADMDMQTQMIKIFVKHLAVLDAKSKDALLNAMKTAHPILQVRSALTLLPSDQETVNIAVRDVTGLDLAIQFQAVPDLLSGIELLANGQKLAWSIADYLNSLNNDINAVLTPVTGATSKVEATVKPIP